MATVRAGRLMHLCCGIALAGAISTSALATTALTSGLSTATFDETTGRITSWTLNTTEHVGSAGALGGLSYYYRIGDTGPEQRLGDNGDLTFVNVEQTLPSLFTANYIAAGKFKVALMYHLLGAGTNFAKLDMNVRLESLIADPNTPFVNFHMFAYNDFGLDATVNDDGANIGPPPPTIYNVGTQVDFANGANVRDSILGNNGSGGAFLGPDNHQVGTALAVYGLLEDGNADTLDGTTSSPASPNNNGDWAYAFQYDFQLRNVNSNPEDTAGKLFTIQDFKILSASRGVNNNPVPEPLTSLLSIFGVGSLGLHLLRRRVRLG